jgi:hypothetical protein
MAFAVLRGFARVPVDGASAPLVARPQPLCCARFNLEKAPRSSRDFPDQLKRTVHAGATLDTIM